MKENVLTPVEGLSGVLMGKGIQRWLKCIEIFKMKYTMIQHKILSNNYSSTFVDQDEAGR